jgi:glycosyltransferase involved in cell wall biosynthesis
MKIICLGNYPPRKCGIATFTENLVKSIFSAAEEHGVPLELEVVAMNDAGQEYDYPDIVKLTIHDKIRAEYVKAADYINASNADICLFQHEYGIYGGNSGLLVLDLLRRVKVPIVSTFHTVLQKPTFHQREVLKKIAEYSAKVVIMNRLAITFLTEVFQVPQSKIVRIEHGVPDFGKIDKSKVVRPHSWKNRSVLLTFGLLGRSKGIETVIKALPAIVKNHPDVLYVVLGKTHPHVVKYAGEEYREYLEKLTAELDLENNVEFLNQYVSEEELSNYLLATDMYVTPYLNKAQITSGTLCYAVGGGSAVISTPYWHAEELLADGRGRLFGFEDHTALANVVNELLDAPAEMEKLQKRAYAYGLKIAWPRIGFEYISAFQIAVEEHQVFDGTFRPFEIEIPEFNTSHLERLTDFTGIIQHANRCVADYKTGYCVDDNARALMVCLVAQHKSGNRDYFDLIHRYLAYSLYLQNDNGSFKNYLNYWRNTVEEEGSDDAFGRAVWALGLLIRLAPCDAMFHLALDMFIKSSGYFHKLKYARGYANCIFGLYHYVKRFPDQEKYIQLISEMADKLVQLFAANSKDDWFWFEPSITYDNGILPASLFTAYTFTENQQYLEVAEKSMRFLEQKCLTNGQLTLVGNKNWWLSNHPTSEFAQQPIDAMAMIIMYDCAYRATQRQELIDKLKTCFYWYFGLNDLNLPLYDPQTHGCNDGLEDLDVNRNQGAESIIAYLMSWLIAKPYLEGKE